MGGRAVAREKAEKDRNAKKRAKASWDNAKHRLTTSKEKYLKAKDVVQNVGRIRKAAQAKLDKAEKEFKIMKKNGDDVTAHGFQAKRNLEAARAEVSKADSTYKDAVTSLPDLEEKYTSARERVAQLQAKRRGEELPPRADKSDDASGALKKPAASMKKATAMKKAVAMKKSTVMKKALAMKKAAVMKKAVAMKKIMKVAPMKK